MRILTVVLCLGLAMTPSAAADGGCPASSRAFTGTRLDAPFFVFDGGHHGAGLGQFDAPTGIVAIGDGGRSILAVADTGNHRIKVMTDQGFFEDFWGGRGEGPGFMASPRGLAATPEGDVWVVDAGNHRLQKLQASREDIAAVTGRPLASFGRQGSRRGELDSPTGVAVDRKGHVYVTDTGNHRVQKLDPRGRLLDVWGGARSAAPGRFDTPTGIAVGPDGLVYVADSGNHRIQVLTASGKLVRRWGSRGAGAGELDTPRGLAVDAAGNVYVADSGNHRIQKLDAAGRFLAMAGCPGSGPGELRTPTDVALDLDGYLYVVDSGNHRIQKLGPQ